MKVTRRLLSAVAAVGLLAVSCAPTPAKPPSAAPQAAPTVAVAQPSPSPTATAREVFPTPAPATRPPPATPTPASRADAPKRGGWMVAYMTSIGRTLDPNQETSVLPSEALASTFHRLTAIDSQRLPKERVLIGQLAEKWESDATAQKWTFRLKTGFQFHDGQPVTSADVKATIERMRDAPGGIISPYKRVMSAVERVETPDERTVVIITKQPSPWMLSFLALPTTSIVPAHIVSKDQKALEKKPVGSGPFKFSAREDDVKLEFVRNDKYYDPQLPYLDGHRWLVIREAATQFAALRTGRVNFTGFGTRGLTKSEADLLAQRVPGVSIERHGTTAIQYLWLNTRSGPFKDLRVRQAAAMVLNQQEIVDIAHEGIGFKGDFTGPAGLTWSLPEDTLKKIPAYRGSTDADIAAAKSLMKEAGYPDGFRAESLLPDLTGYEFRLAVETKQLAKIGIIVTAKLTRYPVEWLPAMREGRFTLTEGPTQPVLYDPQALLSVWTTGDEGNYTGLSDPKVDELYQKQGLIVDPVERKKVVDQLQERLWEMAPAIPVYQSMYIHATLPEVRGWTHPGIVGDNFWYERLWIAQ
ncbi:MAG: ABC transporter substrate-binding protein [Dehalococcoidia bacterium]|nr:ABC transporter substrate-binding protein [Dehalococcoidia bacterium]